MLIRFTHSTNPMEGPDSMVQDYLQAVKKWSQGASTG